MRLPVPGVSATVFSLPEARDLAFAEYGDRGGVPVFAFHGTPGSRLQLAPADAAAREAGVRLIVPDRPGYGHSGFVKRRRLADWPSDVIAVADHLVIRRFAVLGVSGGGPHALACAASGSGRVLAAAVVSSPSPDPVGAGQVNSARRLPGWAVAVPGVLRLMASLLVAMTRRLPHLLLRAARACMPAADRRVVDSPGFREWFIDSARRMSATTARAAAQDLALFSRDWCLDLGRIGIPVAVWHGTADRLVESHSADVLGAAVPHARVSLCADEGHLLFAERAADILRDLAITYRGEVARLATHADTGTTGTRGAAAS